MMFVGNVVRGGWGTAGKDGRGYGMICVRAG